jgi:sulfide:quinone oxidoreductase
MGHGTCTCEGAAFEYVFNVDHGLREAGVRDLARVVYLTNEAALGDFGVDGMVLDQQGFQTTSELWTGSLFRERGVEAILGAHVAKVEEGVIHYEALDGMTHTLGFDFAMLIPPFGGVPLKAYDPDGNDITSDIFAPSGFMKVDADYTAKPYEEWRASDWPTSYAAPGYDNLWAVGIAFAPPHQISKPRKTANGTLVAPSPRVPACRPALWQDGGPDDRRPYQARPARRGAHRFDGADGSSLRGVGGSRAHQRLGGGYDDVACSA